MSIKVMMMLHYDETYDIADDNGSCSGREVILVVVAGRGVWGGGE